MSGDALRGPLTAAVDAGTRPLIRHAGRILVTGLGLGLLGQLLFYEVGLGLNLVLMLGALLAAARRLRPAGVRVGLADVWLGPVALVLATFAALRGDATLAAIDALAAVALTAAALVATGGVRIMATGAGALAWLAGRLATSALVATLFTIADARRLSPSFGGMRQRAAPVAPVIRGLLIALPLVSGFVALFASADAVFARLVGEVFEVELDLGDLPGRLMLALALAWLIVGALAFSLGTPADGEPAPSIGARLGAVEATTLLVVLDLLFAIFVLLQAAYLFGGLDTMAAAGLTYSEYARRGFFELCAVAALVGIIVVVLEAVVGSRSRSYVAASIGLVALTGVIVGSAAIRLGLYQQAYGWTELRFYVAATIAWLGFGAIMALAALATNRSRWLPHALLVGALVVGLAINVIGPVRFIASENVARAIDPSLVAPQGRTGLDEAYLHSLDADAIEPLLAALPQLPPHDRAAVDELVRSWQVRLADPDPWQGWNLSRAHARELLGLND